MQGFQAQKAAVIPGASVSGAVEGDLSKAAAGYGDIAQTGGYSNQDIANIRERAGQANQTIFDNANSQIARGRNLTGGGANTNATVANLARGEAQGVSSTNLNTESNLATMIQQGKLAGLGGLASTAGTQGSLENQAAGINESAGAATAANVDSANRGQASLYGTSPGLTSTFGSQLLDSSGQMINTQQLQNNLGLGLVNAQIQKAGVPSNFQQALGNIGGALKLASPFAVASK